MSAAPSVAQSGTFRSSFRSSFRSVGSLHRHKAPEMPHCLHDVLCLLVARALGEAQEQALWHRRRGVRSPPDTADISSSAVKHFVAMLPRINWSNSLKMRLLCVVMVLTESKKSIDDPNAYFSRPIQVPSSASHSKLAL